MYNNKMEKKKKATKKRKRGGQPENKNAEKWTEEDALCLASALIAWLRPRFKDGVDLHANNYYCNTFLVIENNYNKSTIDYLSKKFASFSEMLKTAREIQEIKIAQAALMGYVNKTMAIFFLKAKHGWQEPFRIQGDPEAPLQIKTSMRDFLGNLEMADSFEK
jgi:hypothetical protein